MRTVQRTHFHRDRPPLCDDSVLHVGMARLITGVWLACNAGCSSFSMRHMLVLRVLPQGVTHSGDLPCWVNGRVGLVIVAPAARRAPHLPAVHALRMLPPARVLHVVSHQRLQAPMHTSITSHVDELRGLHVVPHLRLHAWFQHHDLLIEMESQKGHDALAFSSYGTLRRKTV